MKAAQPKVRLIRSGIHLNEHPGLTQRKLKVYKATDASGTPVDPSRAPSGQINEDPFYGMYERVVDPYLSLDGLLRVFEENAIHSGCIVAKATDSMSQGWKMVPADIAEEDVATVDTKKFTEEQENILNSWCGPEWTWDQMLLQAGLEYLIFGWAIWEIVRVDGKIAAMYPVPGQTMRATKSRILYAQHRSGKVRWFKQFGITDEFSAITGDPISGENTRDERANEVIVFRCYSPRSMYYGIPDWVSILPAIAELTAQREFNISWFSSGGTADRVVVATAKTEGVATKIGDAVEQKLSEASGIGHTTIVVSGTEDVKVTMQSLSAGTGRGEGNRDRQFRGGREDLIKEVLIGHRTPPYRIGWADLGGLGGSAAKEMLRAYRKGSVEPIQRSFNSRITNSLFGPAGLNLAKQWRFRLNDLDVDVMEINVDKAIKGVTYGLYSPNQAREIVGSPVVPNNPEMDKHYISTTLVPIENAGEKPPGTNPALHPSPATTNSGSVTGGGT